MVKNSLVMRTVIVGASVLVAQQFLKSTIEGLVPALTGFELLGFTVGGIATAAIGVGVGEAIVGRLLK